MAQEEFGPRQVITINLISIEGESFVDIKQIRLLTGLTQKDFANYFNIPVRTLQNWESGKRVPPSYVVELIKEKAEKIKFKGGERMGVYTSLTGTRYDVDDFLEVLESFIGALPAISNEKQFYSTIQKLAATKGYKIAWISKSLTNNVVIDTLVDKPHYAVVGFGIAKEAESDELFDKLKTAKEEILSATDEDIQKAIFNKYKNKIRS